MPLISAAGWFGELIGLSLAAATDVRQRIIPNHLVLLLAANGIVLRLADRAGWHAVAVSIITAAGVLVLLGQAVRLGAIGGGDAKLIAAVTLLVAPRDVPGLLIAIAIAGGLVSCLYFAVRRATQRQSPAGMARPSHGCALHRALCMERDRIAAGEPMPYALAVFIGTIWYGASAMI